MVTDFMKDATNRLCVPFDTEMAVSTTKVTTLPTIVNDEHEHTVTVKDKNMNNTRRTTGSCSTNTIATPSVPPTSSTLPISICYVPSYDQEDNTTDSGEAKFLLTSTCTGCYKRRNRIPRLPNHSASDRTIILQSKPAGLHRLDDVLYYNCVNDLQSILKYRSGWFFLFWLPFCICAVFLSLFVLVMKYRVSNDYDYYDTNDPINDYKSSWPVISCIIVVSFLIGNILYRTKLANIEEELHVRIQNEWLPLVEQYGFAMNYVIDDPGFVWSRKETYIHIYSINYLSSGCRIGSGAIAGRTNQTTQGAMTIQRQQHNQHHFHHSTSFLRQNAQLYRSNSIMLLNEESSSTTSGSTNGSSPSTTKQLPEPFAFDDEVKYMVFFPMEFARRNVDARQMGYHFLMSSSSPSSSLCGGNKKSNSYCQVNCCDDTDSDDVDELSQQSATGFSGGYYVKPPSLRNFPDTDEALLLLRDFLHDIEVMTTPSYMIRMILFVSAFILFILFCLYAMARHDRSTTATADNKSHYNEELDGSFALFGFLFMVYICDRFVRLYTNLYPQYYQVANIIETTWLQHFQSYGYTVTYRIDQPHWYSFREDFVHIYKKKQ